MTGQPQEDGNYLLVKSVDLSKPPCLLLCGVHVAPIVSIDPMSYACMTGGGKEIDLVPSKPHELLHGQLVLSRGWCKKVRREGR